VTGNTNVAYVSADVSSLSGMKELADGIKQVTDTVDALVLSMGVILPNRQITKDGLEMGFAIQYLSRFALTQFLIEELKKSGNAKIVHVAGPKLKNADIFFDDLSFEKGFTMMKALGQQMYANHLFIQEFARRNPGNRMVMNIMHVGIAKTGIMWETNFFFKLIVNLTGTSPEKAAANAIYLASDELVNFSGYFLNKPGKPTKKQKEENDPEVAERLWDRSMDLMKGIL
jgi:NAD(P)-dependent dehydrogenase (short-subunit alcohol dehydrogenase family)